MNKKHLLRTASVGLSAAMVIGASAMLFTACSTVSNENTPLTLSSEALNSVFNPFFYTTGPDGEIVGQTQLSMLTSNERGELVSGANEPCVALAHSVVTTGTRADYEASGNPDDYSNYYTEYHFAVKNGLKFSDGEPLTIKDVLFNIYMYLDPAYVGSSTMYSVAIDGLTEYRTQTASKEEQEAFDRFFDSAASERINAISSWANDDDSVWSDSSLASFGPHVKEDILKAHELFLEELNDDWTSAQDAVEDYERYRFQFGWEVFLYNYGSAGGITVRTEGRGDDKEYIVERNYPENIAKDQETLINYIYTGMVGDYANATDAYKANIDNIVQYYATAANLRSYLTSQAVADYFEEHGMTTHKVRGINVTHESSIPASYNPADGGARPDDIQLGEECDILTIKINGVDPKAIQNFAFTVAPGHYYSSEWENFSMEEGNENFGVPFTNPDFMTSIRTIQVPLGAGPYRASTAGGTAPTDNLKDRKGEFFRDNIVYMERNDNFLLGAPKIKRLCYRVINSALLYTSCKAGEVHFASPTIKATTVSDLQGADRGVLRYSTTPTLGYGYIGVNSNWIKDVEVRQAIMHAMNTNLCVDYFGGTSYAQTLYRSMSTVLEDYYPQGATSYYPYDETGETSLLLVQSAGYTEMVNGVLQNSQGEALKFTFTIAGDTTDHPAYGMLVNAMEVLNSVGFDIEVTNDSQALSKLNTGGLAVWAAAWSSSSDPDMYQVYHKDSRATSVNNWGYPHIKEEGTTFERNILDTLSDLIEEGRETTVVSERKATYTEALDLVMELAVELPTYQRSTLYVWKSGIFDESTLTETTAFQSPISRIWEISFING